jgi:hypothetical protein
MYKVYVISLINSDAGIHSQAARSIWGHTNRCCQTHNWEIELFPAVNGYAITDDTWKSFNLQMPKKSPRHPEKFGNLLGAQGCFLSHFMLWHRCIDLNEPIVILEDDAEVIAPLDAIITDQDLIKLHDSRPAHNQNSKLGSWAAGAFAYWLSPAGAKKLVEFSKIHGPGHADKLIGSNVLNWDYLTPHIVKLGPRVGSSTQPNKSPYRGRLIGR